MARYDAVLFDVDGTLIHSAPGIFHALRDTFSAMGTEISGVDLHRYLGPPLRRTFGEFYADPAQVERAVQLYRRFYREYGAAESTLYPGVPQMLAALYSAGVLLCTATSKPVQVAEPMLKKLGIAQYFTLVGGASMDAARDTKAEVIRWLLAQPALQGRRTLMVGDRRDDMQGAAELGLPAAAVLYGYGSREELQPFAPVWMAESCAELQQSILDGE